MQKIWTQTNCNLIFLKEIRSWWIMSQTDHIPMNYVPLQPPLLLIILLTKVFKVDRCMQVHFVLWIAWAMSMLCWVKLWFGMCCVTPFFCTKVFSRSFYLGKIFFIFAYMFHACIPLPLVVVLMEFLLLPSFALSSTTTLPKSQHFWLFSFIHHHSFYLT